MRRNRGFNYQRMLWELRPDLAPKLARPKQVVTCSDEPQEFVTSQADLDFPDDDRDEVEAA